MFLHYNNSTIAWHAMKNYSAPTLLCWVAKLTSRTTEFLLNERMNPDENIRANVYVSNLVPCLFLCKTCPKLESVVFAVMLDIYQLIGVI